MILCFLVISIFYTARLTYIIRMAYYSAQATALVNYGAVFTSICWGITAALFYFNNELDAFVQNFLN